MLKRTATLLNFTKFFCCLYDDAAASFSSNEEITFIWRFCCEDKCVVVVVHVVRGKP